MASPLYVAWAVSGAVRLIACAKLAGLLLARSGVRQREIAVRMSIGASRGRLIRQLLTESVLLSGLGALLGLGLALLGMEAIYGLLSVQLGEQVALDLQINGRVLGFSAVVALVTGLLFGMAPALRASSLELTALPAVKSTTLSPFSLLAGRGSWTSLTPVDEPEGEELRVQIYPGGGELPRDDADSVVGGTRARGE